MASLFFLLTLPTPRQKTLYKTMRRNLSDAATRANDKDSIIDWVRHSHPCFRLPSHSMVRMQNGEHTPVKIQVNSETIRVKLHDDGKPYEEFLISKLGFLAGRRVA
jgi:hypothetical protein